MQWHLSETKPPPSDVDMIHHLMTSKRSKLSSGTSTETPAKKTNKLVGRCLFSAENAKKACTKLLSFTAKRKLGKCNR